MRTPILSKPVVRSSGALRPPTSPHENSAFYQPNLQLVRIGSTENIPADEIDVKVWDPVPGPPAEPNDPQRYLQPVDCGDWCHLVSEFYRASCLTAC